jgi:hypothetical protein
MVFAARTLRINCLTANRYSQRDCLYASGLRVYLRELIVPTTAGTPDDQIVLVLERSVLPDHRISRE